MPCVKRSGRVVFGLSRTGMVFKLTDAATHARALSVPGAHLFDPSGQGEPFRQWVVIPPERDDEWEPLAAEAVGQDHSIPPPGRSEEQVSDWSRTPKPTLGTEPVEAVAAPTGDAFRDVPRRKAGITPRDSAPAESRLAS